LFVVDGLIIDRERHRASPAANRMIAHHVVFGTYGFWLPNDPRGSWSQYVGSRNILQYGPATKTDVRRSIAGRTHDRRRRIAAKQELKYPAVRLTGRQALAVGHGFAEAIEDSGYRLQACCIMPDHIHLVAVYDGRRWSTLMGHLKGRATQHLVDEVNWPRSRPVWARGGWCVYLDDDDDVARSVRYVEENPSKDGKPPQRWSFVTPR